MEQVQHLPLLSLVGLRSGGHESGAELARVLRVQLEGRALDVEVDRALVVEAAGFHDEPGRELGEAKGAHRSGAPSRILRTAETVPPRLLWIIASARATTPRRCAHSRQSTGAAAGRSSLTTCASLIAIYANPSALPEAAAPSRPAPRGASLPAAA